MIDSKCSRVDLADVLDLSEQRVGILTKTGVLTRGSKGYDLRAAIRAYLHFLRSQTGSLTQERTRLTKAQADLAKLNLQARTGELVSRDTVEKSIFANSRMIRDNFLNLPTRTDALVAAEPDRQKCFHILDNEVRQILTGLADGLQHTGG